MTAMNHLRFLKYFDEVARAGSIRQAAEALHVAPSSVNRRIQDLEEELGVPLFERLPRGMRLTAAGELFVQYVRGRASALDAIEPDPVALVHPLDLQALGQEPGGVVTLESRRGRITLYARADESSPRGAVFVPFCFYEAAINRLTNAALDPFAKIPEFKYCAVRLTPGGEAPLQGSYGGGQAGEKHRAALAT